MKRLVLLNTGHNECGCDARITITGNAAIIYCDFHKRTKNVSQFIIEFNSWSCGEEEKREEKIR